MTKARSNATAPAAKGQLVVGDGTDSSATLAVGNNGDTLVADSSTSTGLRWNTQPVLANPILNSAMDIWQRGTSINYTSGTATYMADRYNLVNSQGTGSPNFTISRQTTGDTTNLPNIQYCMRIQRASGNTATTFPYMSQSLESANSIPFAGRTVTISYYARAGANYSASSSAFTLYLYSGTGTDQNINVTGLTGSATVATSNATLTTTWQRFTATGTVAASATQLAVQFFWSPTGTAGANDFMEITGLQIDVGSVALPFRRNAGTLAGELAACQRYYFRKNSGNTNFTWFAWGIGQGSSQALFAVPAPVTMRTTPTVIEFANLGLAQTGAINAITTLVHSNSSPDTAFLQSNGTNTADVFYRLIANNSSSAYIGIGAEL